MVKNIQSGDKGGGICLMLQIKTINLQSHNRKLHVYPILK